MTQKNQKQNIFQIRFFVILFATLSAVTWASAFPLIKIGFLEFQITSADTGAKTLFAGIRFFAAGILTLIIAIVTFGFVLPFVGIVSAFVPEHNEEKESFNETSEDINENNEDEIRKDD